MTRIIHLLFRVIRAISDYRIQFGTNQTTRLTELTDQNMVQKCLNIVLGLQTLSNQYVIRQRDMRKLSYDEDDETNKIDAQTFLGSEKIKANEASGMCRSESKNHNIMKN